MLDLSTVFDPRAVSDETAAFNARIEAELAELPRVHEVDPVLTRKARAEGRGTFPPAGPLPGSSWVSTGATEGPGRVRVSDPDTEPRGIYLHIHGGGWTIGAPDQYDLHNQALAAATGARVVSVPYRLAPEHIWPAQRDDVLAGALWALGEMDLPIVIGGESAGAHLSAVAVLGLKAAGAIDRVRGVVFNYGVFDLRMTPSMANWGDRYLVLSTPIVDWFTNNVIPDPAMRADPEISVLLAKLDGLVPALFQVGTADPLLDDTLSMAMRWQAAGNETALAVYPGGIHAYDMFDLEIARQSHAAVASFVNAKLD